MKDIPRRYLPDIAAGILIVVLSVIWILEINESTVIFFTDGCIIIWCLFQYFYYKNLIKTGILTEGILIDYHYKLNETSGRRMSVNAYTTYAPVMQYETDTEVITSQYCMHFLKRRYQLGAKIQIYYLPSMPELFWFPDEEHHINIEYLITACIADIMLVFDAVQA